MVRVPSLSLRIRLNLLITAIFGITVVAGAVLVIVEAEQSVLKETRSSGIWAHRVLQLLASDAGLRTDPGNVERLLTALRQLDTTRHLRIAIQGHELAAQPGAQGHAPHWFSKLVAPDAHALAWTVTFGPEPKRHIVISADPSDEITEAWDEASALFELMLVLVLVANLFAYISIGRPLRSVDSILKVLDAIGQGDYRVRLPAMRLPELQVLASKINAMTEALQGSRDETQRLHQRLLAVQEEERRSLAHELHDEMGQSLSAIKALAASIEQRARTSDPAIGAHARLIIDTASGIYETVKAMIRRLRPVVLDELGLLPALRAMVEDWSMLHPQTCCRLSVSERFPSLGSATETALYRILQECLTNVARHAHAGTVEIELGETHRPGDAGASQPKTVRLSVRDNGVGFDQGAIGSGLGLYGIRERARALGGSLVVNSAPDRGTALQVSLPLGDENGMLYAQ